MKRTLWALQQPTGRAIHVPSVLRPLSESLCRYEKKPSNRSDLHVARTGLPPPDVVVLRVGFQFLEQITHLILVDLVPEPAALGER